MMVWSSLADSLVIVRVATVGVLTGTASIILFIGLERWVCNPSSQKYTCNENEIKSSNKTFGEVCAGNGVIRIGELDVYGERLRRVKCIQHKTAKSNKI